MTVVLEGLCAVKLFVKELPLSTMFRLLSLFLLPLLFLFLLLWLVLLLLLLLFFMT